MHKAPEVVKSSLHCSPPSDERGSSSDSGEDEDERFYKMDHLKRGKAIIFNHNKFMAISGKKTPEIRKGTHRDARDLKHTLYNFGFDTVVETDKTKEDIDDILESVAQAEEENNESDCILVAVLSHGSKGRIRAFDKKYDESDLWRPFLADKCKSLIGKPKIFIIQACRGVAVDRGVDLDDAEEDDETTGEEEEEEEDDGDGRSIPAHADFLIVWATPTGYKAARRHNSGSIFIQTFCKILQKYGEKEDFFSLLTRVNSSVAKEEFKINGVDRKQISCFNSMLTKHMKLTKKA